MLSLPQMWKRRSLVIPFLALAYFSTLLGSWRVRVFKFESAVAGKGEVKARKFYVAHPPQLGTGLNQ